MTPFEVDLGWSPKSPLDLISGTHVPNESVSEFKERLKATLDEAKFAYNLAKADQRARSSLTTRLIRIKLVIKYELTSLYLKNFIRNLKNLINCLRKDLVLSQYWN